MVVGEGAGGGARGTMLLLVMGTASISMWVQAMVRVHVGAQACVWGGISNKNPLFSSIR